MPVVVLVAFGVLAASAVALGAEQARGLRIRTGGGATALATLHGTAAVAGATLLVALAGREWLLAAALVPITALSVIRFAGLVAPAPPRARRLAIAGLVLLAGVAATLQAVPVPLTRAHLTGAAPADAAPSARPHRGRTVRG